MHPNLTKPGTVKKSTRTFFSITALLSAVFFLSSNILQAQTLSTGDFAAIGFNTSFNINTTAPIGPDEMAIVALANIPSGATFKITDRGWNGSAMITTNTGDGVMSWTTTSTIPAGTVFKITVTAGTTPSLTIAPNTYGTPTITVGWTSTSVPGANANVGDQIIIYQGSDTNPANFVYGLNTSNSTATAAGNWQIGSTSARDSDLPPGLTNNSALDGTVAATAAAFTNNSGGYFANNLVYVGPKTGNKSSLLAEVAKRSNWTTTTTLTTTYDLNVGGANFTGSNPVFTLSVLAVNQLHFSGNITATGSVLQWQPDIENNVLQYVVETSTDAQLFTAAGIIPASSSRSYQFIVPGILQQRSYYRLKIQDRDGLVTYSNTIVLLSKGKGIQLQLFPNPVNEVLNILAAEKILHVTVTDIYGREVIDINGSGSLAENITVKQLPAGNYMVTVKTATESSTIKILKQ